MKINLHRNIKVYTIKAFEDSLGKTSLNDDL